MYETLPAKSVIRAYTTYLPSFNMLTGPVYSVKSAVFKASSLIASSLIKYSSFTSCFDLSKPSWV